MNTVAPPPKLPKAMYFKHGRYWLVTSKFSEPVAGRKKLRWIPLSKKLEVALHDHKRISTGSPAAAFTDITSRDALLRHSRTIYRKARNNAAARGLRFDLAEDAVISIGEAQLWRCALTGLPFSLDGDARTRIRPYAPSLDRIDSFSGYTASNCRIVCAALNIALGQWGEAVFSSLANHYVNHAAENRQRS